MNIETTVPRLIVHVGMCKTGTTSLQKALQESEVLLRAQRSRYLGMWFKFGQEVLAGTKKTQAFFGLDEATLRDHAKSFSAMLKAEHKTNEIDVFILSNEQIFANLERALPFFRQLSDEIEVDYVCVARAPHQWLPSAYAQWGVVNKTYSGEIRGFNDFGRSLVDRYRQIQKWLDVFPNKFHLVRLSEGADVVTEFEGVMNLRLNHVGQRANARPDAAEILLRACFNNRSDAPMNSTRFNSVVLGGRQIRKFSIDEMKGRISTGETTEVLNGVVNEIDALNERFGTDFFSPEGRTPSGKGEVTQEALLSRMLEIIYMCCERIDGLESKIRKLDPCEAREVDGLKERQEIDLRGPERYK